MLNEKRQVGYGWWFLWKRSWPILSSYNSIASKD